MIPSMDDCGGSIGTPSGESKEQQLSSPIISSSSSIEPGLLLPPVTLLRDVIYDTLENIDRFSLITSSSTPPPSSSSSSSSSFIYHSIQLQALLRVLKVLACHAAPCPGIASILAADPAGTYTGASKKRRANTHPSSDTAKTGKA